MQEKYQKKTSCEPKILQPIFTLSTLLRLGGFGDFLKKNSSFRLPYQRPSSSADCAKAWFLKVLRTEPQGSARETSGLRELFVYILKYWIGYICNCPKKQ